MKGKKALKTEVTALPTSITVVWMLMTLRRQELESVFIAYSLFIGSIRHRDCYNGPRAYYSISFSVKTHRMHISLLGNVLLTFIEAI